ncbi:HAD family hydrolase [Mucilaginibacter koreensis]
MLVKVIAFDADDTLWVNETYFKKTEDNFCHLMSEYMPQQELQHELFKIVIRNLPLYGYGVKGFTLSMLETAMQVSAHTISAKGIEQVLNLGKSLLNEPIELLEGVEEVLKALHGRYRLVVATKGDLLDQERKLRKSGLGHYFHHIEIMSEKDDANYIKLVKHLDIQPDELLMIGNSLKSDVVPVLNMGGYAIHIPFHITWAHEQIEESIQNERFRSFTHIKEILSLL